MKPNDIKNRTVTGKVRVSYPKRQIASSYTTIRSLSSAPCAYRFFHQGHCTSSTFSRAWITREQFRTRVLRDYSRARESTHMPTCGLRASCSMTILFDLSEALDASESTLTFYYLAGVLLLCYVTQDEGKIYLGVAGRLVITRMRPNSIPGHRAQEDTSSSPAKPQTSSVTELQESVLFLNKLCNIRPYS